MQVEKTTVFNVDGKPILVSELPLQIQKQFQYLDAFRQEHSDLTIKLGMATLAVQVKTMELHETISKLIAPAPKAEEAASDKGESE